MPFDPSLNGFQFPNTGFKGQWILNYEGFCGGFIYSALDYYRTGVRLPMSTTPPARETPLYRWLQKRQEESLLGNLDKWGELAANIDGRRNSEFFNWGLQDSNGGRLDELQQVGCPVPLGLYHYDGGAGGDHQVLAIGYSLGDRDKDGLRPNMAIAVYDPNEPRRVMRLLANTTDKCFHYECDTQRRRWRTYFVNRNYHPKAPPDVAANLSKSYSGTEIVSALKLEIVTGADNLRGGNDNVNATIQFDDDVQVKVNLNEGKEWPSDENDSRRTVLIPLERPVPIRRLRGIWLTTNFSEHFGDKWEMSGLTVSAMTDKGLFEVYREQRDRDKPPLKIFAGNQGQEARIFMVTIGGS